ncbi:MAG TPA: ribonuclease activity regulator RraA [Geminicoccus sp.]|jgi:regulator of RNase E activity RraA|uniref:ribonuclease activity regulator RraA n=1 Tax=Geminicoccus sp. TaxID=2024832 RepID=UPI002E2EC781|nr:ribonuclease activity regulator RraA [Geminicoccus sp.]HEX2529590.1 ribonuclease activity regulator RraA [Geminicoccus sp.]
MVTVLDDLTRERLKTVSVATLTTLLFKRGLRNVFLQSVHPVGPGLPRMVGEAYTLRMIPAREDIDVLEAYADPAHPQRHAIEHCPAGQVLVIDSRKDARGASGGDILLRRLMVRGVAGIVTDGGFRDTPAVAALGFPAYHQRPSAPVGPIWHHAADTNLPIACGDVAVYPGDVMVGDGEGVACVPAGLAAEIAAEAVEATAYEDFVEAQIKLGRRLPGIYPATAESRAEFERWRQGQAS